MQISTHTTSRTTSPTRPPRTGKTAAGATDDANVVVLTGTITTDPTVRDLAGGATVANFDLSTFDDHGSGASRTSVPIAWHDTTPRERALVEVGERVTVVGSVRRRFFRIGGSTQSRTEVVVSRLVPVRRVKTARSVVAAAIDGFTQAV